MKTMKLKLRTNLDNPVVKIESEFKIFGCVFCIHRTLLNSQPIQFSVNSWSISEYRSGVQIVPQSEKLKTIEQAIKITKDFLNSKGETKTKEALNIFRKEHGFLNPKIKEIL